MNQVAKSISTEQNQADSVSRPQQGLLVFTTPEDQGLVKVPILVPHLQSHDIGDQQTLLVSETFNTLLKGKLYTDLLPLLDGNHPLDSIVQRLSTTHGFSNVLTTIVSLSTKGYLVSADYKMDHSRAAYWSGLGASPRWAEQQLKKSQVCVQEAPEELAGYLNGSGINITTAKADLAVIVCDDYLDESFDEINRRHLQRKSAWMLVQSLGIEPLFGPIFRSDETGPCWDCLSSRLRSHQEIRSFLRHVGTPQSIFKPFASDSAFRHAIYACVASEIAKWLVLEKHSTIHQHAVTVNAKTLETNRHWVMRRPQCPTCGDMNLYRPDRTPVPLNLKSSPKNPQNGEGVRSVAPEETLAKYRHLVSPISGVISWLSRTSEQSDSWLHVYWAGSNYGMPSQSLKSLRRSLRSKSAGKGSTRQQSETSALCEGLERYSGSLQGSEIRLRKSFKQFAATGDAVHPNEVQLFSDNQLQRADYLNEQGHPYNVVPARFDNEVETNWTPLWSFTQQRHRYLPTSMLYSMPAELRGPNDLIADSNGCAAGNTIEEAILQGTYELIERDAFAIWWYNQLKVPAVDLTMFDDNYLGSASDYYRQRERDLWLLDITSDLEIPTFVAISRRLDAPTDDIIYGAGTHIEPRIAALRAVCELNQCLSWLPTSNRGNNQPKIDDPFTLNWWEKTRLEDCAWLAPATDDDIRPTSSYGIVEFEDTRDEVEYVRSKLEDKGLEFLVLDQTRPDVGLPVVRVVAPGMRHFWARFAPGRLYEVPVQLGKLEQCLKESELNPVPVIA